MILEFIRRFMYGRYGNDELNHFLMIVGLICAAIWSFIRSDIFSIFVLLIIGFCYYRMFSRNIAKRQAENQRFLSWYMPQKENISNAFFRFKDRKEHKYFKCKCCKTYLRVPRGKGKISIHCPNCGNEFVKKT